MKKLLVIMLALVMVLSLAACKGNGETPAPETEGTEPVSEVTPEPAPVDETTPEPEPEPEPVVLADEGHALWVIHGQQLLADGTPNGWGGKDTDVYEKSAMTAITLEDVKAISEDVYNALAEKEVKYLYMAEIVFGTNDAGWDTGCMIGGKLYRANGSFAVKAAQCNVDIDGDNKVYSEDQWISDPHTAYAEALTPDTLFMPTWQEEKDENGFSWGDNPVVIGGAGLYTVIVAQYSNASAPGQPGFGMALVLKEAKDAVKDYEEVLTFIPAEHTYGIIGGFNEWGGDVEMVEAGENTWTGEVELTAGTEFKVRADADWAYSWGTPEGGNLACEADGTYVVTITFVDGAATVTVEPKA